MSILRDLFKGEKRFVNWRLLKVKGKQTKIPYSTTGRKASSTDESTWSTYEEAKEASMNIGIVFTPKKDLLGIDIDHCLNKLTRNIEHDEREKIASLILEADTYTEVSPSGEGLHLYLKIDGELTLTSNKRAPFEAYTAGRYFTVTENSYGEPRPVRTVTPAEALDLLSIIGYPWNKVSALSDESEKGGVAGNSGDGGDNSGKNDSGDLSDEQVLEKMFGSKHGGEIKSLYNGDTSAHKNDKSTADMALCSHLAFWTGKDAGQIERIWTGSPLGNREKTQEREDYRKRTVANAIANCKEVYEDHKSKYEKEIKKAAPELELLFALDSKGRKFYIQNTENISRILRCHSEFAGRLRYDEYKNIFELKAFKNEKWRTLEDNDAVDIQTRIQVLFPYFGRVGKEMVYDAMIKIAKENAIDSAADYLRSLKWDGEKRLDTWLCNTYGVTDDKYHRAVASNWLKGLVKRIIYPGCKFDYVLVLEGEQGTKKSTSFHVLGEILGHVETTMSTDSKDFFMQMQGKAIVEFSEGETMSRTEVKRMKAIITMQSDKYRPPYERASQDFPRRCVFAMTTNQTEYLKDETGNRRWLPITVSLPEANVEWLKENRDQMLAEAYHRVITENESVHEFPKEETLAQQAARRIQDPNADPIAAWYFNILNSEERKAGVTPHQVHIAVFNGGFSAKPLTKYEEMNIVQIFKDYLLLTKKRVVENGIQITKWFNENPEMKRTEAEQAELAIATFEKF